MSLESNGSIFMNKLKNIKDTTVSEAIDEVLEAAKEPLTSREIFNSLPFNRMVKTLSFSEFWQHFGMKMKRRKMPIRKSKCPKSKQHYKCSCYVLER